MNMRGKGAKLFAKRKAKADQWVVGDNSPDTGPDPRRHDPEFMMKVTGASAADMMMMEVESPPAAPTAASRPRLEVRPTSITDQKLTAGVISDV